MRQRIADALQVVGAIGLTIAAAGLVSVLFGVLVGSMLAIIAGVVVAS